MNLGPHYPSSIAINGMPAEGGMSGDLVWYFSGIPALAFVAFNNFKGRGI
jgi:hypothetical protein